MHFIWLGKEMPREDQQHIDKFCGLHPTWNVQLWRDERVFSLPRTGQLCQNIQPQAVAADIARLEIVHQEGGWYSDTDIHWLKKIDYLCNETLVLSSETAVGEGLYSNGLFGAAPKNPIIELLLRRVSTYCSGTIPKDDVLHETGPRMWARALRNFNPATRLHHSYSEIGGMVVDTKSCEVLAHHKLQFRWQ